MFSELYVAQTRAQIGALLKCVSERCGTELSYKKVSTREIQALKWVLGVPLQQGI